MKKLFFVAGELSGDKLGAWYAKRLKSQEPDIKIDAVGGPFLGQAGAELYETFHKLNIVGLIEIVKRIRFLLRFLNRLATHIATGGFDELVVIDFPGFNLRLVKKVKKLNPSIKITYLSPPQLWAWGAWRVKTIKNYCDDVIVLYPFEVAWYEERGVTARWLGYPFYEALQPHFALAQKKEHRIALMPGSRLVEIKRLLPLFIKIVQRLKRAYPKTTIVLPLAESIDKALVEKTLRQCGLGRWGRDIEIVQGEQEKREALRTCCLALTKPGTVTLELALLSVPAIVVYKAPWFTYFVARALVKISHMSLPNLLLKEEVYPELIQGDCTEKKIWGAVNGMYKDFLCGNKKYHAVREQLEVVRGMLGQKR